MKIALIHNNPSIKWADTFRCEVLKREWEKNISDSVEIVSAKMLPRNGNKYDVIHFMFSGGLTKYKDYILKHKDKVFTSLASERTFKSLYNDQDDLMEILRETRCCVCQNRNLLKKLQGLGITAVYIPNGVDTELFQKPFVAGFVGAEYSQEHKGLSLAQKACDELGIELKIAHEHSYSHEQMPEFYKQINCLLIPSLSEGCNNPTLEALAMNIPVISTKVGIAEELEGVILVERDVESIKVALRRLSGRIQILEGYTNKIMANHYRLLYDMEKPRTQ